MESLVITIKQKRYNGLKVLFIPLEFLKWKMARSMAFTVNLALEEGFLANGVETVTIPTFGELSSSSKGSWLSQARELLGGQKFDQVWITLVHNDFTPEFFSWLATLAPIRIGFIIESLNYTPDECRQVPHFKTRRKYVIDQSRSLTHILAVDEVDAERFKLWNSRRALWWPGAVPSGMFATEACTASSLPAVFYGSAYGERAAWLQREDLREALAHLKGPEESTDLPRRFDALHDETEARLINGPPMTLEVLEAYLASWRQLRLEIFRRWMSGLRGACAQVNLPSFVKTYSPRVSESIAAGCPVISWDIPNRPRNRSLFQDGEEILFFRRDRPAELAAHIRRLQQEPEWAKTLATRALRKAAEFHTMERRVEQVLDWVTNGTEPDYGEPASNRGLSTKAISLASFAKESIQDNMNITPVLNKLRSIKRRLLSKTNKGRKTARTIQQPEEYYRKLFVENESWNKPTPNEEEQLRWNIIETFLQHIRHISKSDQIKEKPAILDLGCGRGWLSNLLANHGSVLGIEPVKTVLDHATRLFPHLSFRCATSDDLMAEGFEGRFDIIVSSEVIEHIPDLQKKAFINNIRRLLKENGFAIITTPRKEAQKQWMKYLAPNQPIEDWLSEEDLKRCFESENFKVHLVDRFSMTPAENAPLIEIYQLWLFQKD